MSTPTRTYLVIMDDSGGAMYVCSDTDHCERTAAANTHIGNAERHDTEMNA